MAVQIARLGNHNCSRIIKSCVCHPLDTQKRKGALFIIRVFNAFCAITIVTYIKTSGTNSNNPWRDWATVKSPGILAAMLK